MKEYRIKVIEKHSDIVWIEAESEEEALKLAHAESQCEYECYHDAYVIGARLSNEIIPGVRYPEDK